MHRRLLLALTLGVLMVAHIPVVDAAPLGVACIYRDDPITDSTVEVMGSCGPSGAVNVRYENGALLVCINDECPVVLYLHVRIPLLP